jgi:5,10-methylene-tetrahydrofolate dehydrogenase/methenyl tetrahydrofolate cyclohydrolase
MSEIVQQADIIIAAAGQAELIKGSWLKPGAVLIDVGAPAARAACCAPRLPASARGSTTSPARPCPCPGPAAPPPKRGRAAARRHWPAATPWPQVGTNPVDDPSKAAGYRLVGDAAFEECKAVAGGITPVPGGVGPMTIAMLLKNTLSSAERAFSSGAAHQ